MAKSHARTSGGELPASFRQIQRGVDGEKKGTGEEIAVTTICIDGGYTADARQVTLATRYGRTYGEVYVQASGVF